MRSTMRQWRRLALALMLAWALLFLALLSYFLDARVDEPLASAGSSLSLHPDTRRLSSIQAPHPHLHPQQQAVAGLRPDPTGSRAADSGPLGAAAASPPAPRSGEAVQTPSGEPYGAYASQEAPRGDDLDPQSLAAWSSFGTENVGSHSAGHGRARTPGMMRGGGGDDDGGVEEEEEEEVGREVLEEEQEQEEEERRGNRPGGRAGGDSSDPDEYFFKLGSVVQRLWRGRVAPAMLSPRLQRAMKDYLSANKHGVAFRGRRRPGRSPQQLLCQLKAQAGLRTLDGSEPPFSALGWARLVPPLSLERLYAQTGRRAAFNTCAVVTSAGAILHSGLGKEIDSHDAVLRFNAAPTEGFERDVGNKTTIRIINSQILANPKHQFKSSSLYKNVTLVAWDPAPYTIDLHTWYASPDYNLFGPYVERRRLRPQQPFYVLHPRYVWALWDAIQSNTQESIQPNPPSSGFIGTLLMMALCEQVHVYEYIPSARQTDLCHYHERYYDAACTLGAYHPLLFEKSLVQRMNTGPVGDLKKKGRVSLPGLSSVDCDA